jgi:hypothetical protein
MLPLAPVSKRIVASPVSIKQANPQSDFRPMLFLNTSLS